jgi:hypothetical protein
MKKSSKQHWFWAWLVLMTLPKAKVNDPDALSEVWENLVIIKAENEKDAILKAIKIGKSEEGDCRGTLRLYGKLAITKFMGISNMGLIHDDLDDGTEILWRLKRLRQKTVRASIVRRADLLRNLKS